MSPNDAIGGYFGLEIGTGGEGLDYFDQSQTYDTIRSALLVLLDKLVPAGGVKKLWMPAFVCPAVLDVMPRLAGKVELCPYNISDDLTPQNLHPETGDLVYCYSVFGLTPPVETPGLIVDNAHALFSAPIEGQHTLYSARKFVGIADGAFLVSPLDLASATPLPIGGSAEFLLTRADQGAEAGFNAYQSWEEALFSGGACGMSHLSRKILNAIDFKMVRSRRQQNFEVLHGALAASNDLEAQITRALENEGFVPFSYPYLVKDGAERRSVLIKQRIYTPTLWSDLSGHPELTDFERHLSRNCLHLPVDQRYGPDEMRQIIAAVR